MKPIINKKFTAEGLADVAGIISEINCYRAEAPKKAPDSDLLYWSILPIDDMVCHLLDCGDWAADWQTAWDLGTLLDFEELFTAALLAAGYKVERRHGVHYDGSESTHITDHVILI